MPLSCGEFLKLTSLVKICLFSLILIDQAKAAGRCVPSKNSCHFYKCLESKLQCGSDNYISGFGLKYCNAYLNKESTFSPKGQKWLKDVRLCLQKSLVDTSGSLTCHNVADLSAESHFQCYLSTGICSLSNLDRIRVLKVAYRELVSSKFRKVFINVIANCQLNPDYNSGL